MLRRYFHTSVRKSLVPSFKCFVVCLSHLSLICVYKAREDLGPREPQLQGVVSRYGALGARWGPLQAAPNYSPREWFYSWSTNEMNFMFTVGNIKFSLNIRLWSLFLIFE